MPVLWGRETACQPASIRPQRLPRKEGKGKYSLEGLTSFKTIQRGLPQFDGVVNANLFHLGHNAVPIVDRTLPDNGLDDCFIAQGCYVIHDRRILLAFVLRLGDRWHQLVVHWFCPNLERVLLFRELSILLDVTFVLDERAVPIGAEETGHRLLKG